MTLWSKRPSSATRILAFALLGAGLAASPALAAKKKPPAAPAAPAAEAPTVEPNAPQHRRRARRTIDSR